MRPLKWTKKSRFKHPQPKKQFKLTKITHKTYENTPFHNSAQQCLSIEIIRGYFHHAFVSDFLFPSCLCARHCLRISTKQEVSVHKIENHHFRYCLVPLPFVAASMLCICSSPPDACRYISNLADNGLLIEI